MKLLPILFEDHSAAKFRPLAWSLPAWEVRCGIFNTRERLTRIIAEAAGAESIGELRVLPRAALRDLATGPKAEAVDGRALFVNGRIAPRWDLPAMLLGAALDGEDFAIVDGGGLVAVSLAGDGAAAMLASWREWDAAREVAGDWMKAAAVPAWDTDAFFAEWESVECGAGVRLLRPAGDATAATEGVAAVLDDRGGVGLPAALEYIWQVVPATAAAIREDVSKVIAGGAMPSRRLFGLEIDRDRWPDGAIWEQGTTFSNPDAELLSRADLGVETPGRVWLGEDVRLDPFVTLDASAGPIVLDRGLRVMSHARLEGPLYVGAGSLVKGGAQIYGECSIGAACRVAGEIGESTFLDLGNKQHEGFVGHAVLGSWVNLGALTTNSDLKNNYSDVRVDLGAGAVDTGERFVGLMMGEHSKSAIGTVFNTGTCVGFSANVFATGFPAKHLPNFTWGAGDDRYDVEKALATAEVVMARRGCVLSDAQRRLFRRLAGNA